MDVAEPDGRQLDDLDSGGQRVDDGRSPASPGSAGDCVRERVDPVHPRGSDRGRRG